MQQFIYTILVKATIILELSVYCKIQKNVV